MKQSYYLFLSLILLSLQNCSSNIYQNDWDKDNIKGKVKSIYETTYQFTENNKKSIFSEKGLIYNPKGMLEQIHSFNKGKLKFKIINTFDNSNHLKESIEYTDSDEIINKTLGTFDKGKKLHTRTIYDYKNKLKGTVFEYENDKNQITKRLTKDASNHLNYILLFEYKKDKPSKVSYYKDKDLKNLKYYVTYNHHNKHGDITSFERFETKGNIKKNMKYIYTYDDNKNWVERKGLVNNQLKLVVKREIEYY